MRAPSDHDEAMIESNMWESPVSSLLHLASDSVLDRHGGELRRGEEEEEAVGGDNLGGGEWGGWGGMTDAVSREACFLPFVFLLANVS